MVRNERAMAIFHPAPLGACSASARDLPDACNATSNACCHRAHLISAVSAADVSGDSARWASWRAIALHQPNYRAAFASAMRNAFEAPTVTKTACCRFPWLMT